MDIDSNKDKILITVFGSELIEAKARGLLDDMDYMSFARKRRRNNESFEGHLPFGYITKHVSDSEKLPLYCIYRNGRLYTIYNHIEEGKMLKLIEK